jgi:hypothetical protein
VRVQQISGSKRLCLVESTQQPPIAFEGVPLRCAFNHLYEVMREWDYVCLQASPAFMSFT